VQAVREARGVDASTTHAVSASFGCCRRPWRDRPSARDGLHTMAPPGVYRVVVRAWLSLVETSSSSPDRARTSAPPAPTQLDRVVVTASRKPERSLDAPATIFTVSPQEGIQRSTATHVDQLRAVPGLDVASGGIIQSNVVARGFNALFSGDLMMLVDNRISFVPSLRVNVPSLIAPSREDVERIEVVLGPGAALYGPNAASGVMHIVTKSPFESCERRSPSTAENAISSARDSGTRPSLETSASRFPVRCCRPSIFPPSTRRSSN
jgi:outer membrane receptor for ferrienterochelin and colicin